VGCGLFEARYRWLIRDAQVTLKTWSSARITDDDLVRCFHGIPAVGGEPESDAAARRRSRVPVVPAGRFPDGVAVSPDGNSVYVTSEGSGNVSQYSVGPSGALTLKSSPTVSAGDLPVGVAVSPLRVPTSKDQCKHGGWRQFGFKNQGQCIAFVNHHR
jgi:hypothetical protein